jgi:hypothetical protein
MPNNSPAPLPAHENAWASVEDMNGHYPVDLSNDIAINQIAADQGVPHDSDAEIFSLDEYAHAQQHPMSTAYEFVTANIKK